jgi:hypothetical protein
MANDAVHAGSQGLTFSLMTPDDEMTLAVRATGAWPTPELVPR